MKELVFALVKDALGMKLDDLRVIRNQEQLDEVLKKGGKSSIKLLWMDIPEPAPKAKKDWKGSMMPPVHVTGAESVYAVWRLWEKSILAPKTYIIFTNVDKTSPVWRDFVDYESCRFGSTFLLNYDSTTSPGAKPSQRGMLMK